MAQLPVRHGRRPATAKARPATANVGPATANARSSTTKTRRRRRRHDPLAMLGVVLLGIGLGFGAAVAWSVFGTDIEANQIKERDVAEFRASAPDVVEHPEPLHTNFTTYPPPSADFAGSPWGLLHVPSWAGKTDVYGDVLVAAIAIKEGTTTAVLNSGAAGHVVETAGPGELGNFTLAAHRRSHGSNFTHLPDLRPKDHVIVETPAAWYVYEITGAEVVEPDDKDVTAPVPGRPGVNPTERLITLYTCHSLSLGAWGNDHRWVVHGRLIGWLEHDAGVPSQLLPPSQ